MVTPIQGLRVTLRAADIADSVEALKNLNINILDLDRIRGIAEAGVLPEDIRTISGLTSDLEKELIGIYDEIRNYPNFLSAVNDGRVAINGNMTANASVIASSFKFNALAANNTVVSSELSTSRVSAWSTIGDSLYYGSKVTVGGSVELSKLTIDRPIRQRRFESEIPTHKIRMRIDGSDYDVYAMKNIPASFTGYFSTARNLFMTVTNAGTTTWIRPSWVVTDLDTGGSITFQNRISGAATNPTRSSFVTILGSRAKERRIDFYYPVANITAMSLPNIKLYDIPEVVFPSLTTATLFNSDFKEMPNFRKYMPNLTTLDVSSTNLMRSDNPDLRLFNDSVVARLPTTLTRLTMTNCFAGVSSANLAVLDDLTYFVASGSTVTNRRMTGVSPAVNPAKIDTYIINANLFDSIHPSVRESDTLRILNISYNSLPATANTELSPTNQVIEEIYNNANRSPFINVNGKTSLKVYHRVDSPATGIITTLFTGCTNLTDIRVNATSITGALPSFDTNRSLAIFNAASTRIQPADSTYAINNATFGAINGGCRSTLREFTLSSPLLTGQIETNAMDGLTALVTVVINSTSNGISGPIPEFRQSPALRSVNLRLNNFTGSLHQFNANPNLLTMNISANKLSGAVPGLRLPSLVSLILNNNQFTSVGVLQCQSLRDLDLSVNSITTIPDFSGCQALQAIIMNSNPMTGTTPYTAGTFVNLTALRNLNLSNCGLNRAAVDQILIDLGKNYDLSPRSRVEINLVGNASPSPGDEIQTFVIARLRSAGWTIRVS
jgi:hypothetical protein